jgi:hypothetical protein
MQLIGIIKYSPVFFLSTVCEKHSHYGRVHCPVIQQGEMVRPLTFPSDFLKCYLLLYAAYSG